MPGVGISGLFLGGKEKLDERLARAKEGKKTSTQAAMATFEASRPSVGAQALGIARAAYEYSLEYAKERKQFGRAIIENQAIAFQAGRHEDAHRGRLALLLVHRAAWMAATGKKFENGEGSMSKLYAGENAVWVTDQAIQILGGYGYVRENPVEQWHRDSKIYTIFEGTSEIQRLVISRAISGVHIKLTWQGKRGLRGRPIGKFGAPRMISFAYREASCSGHSMRKEAGSCLTTQ